MQAYRKHIWSIIICIPLFFYSSQQVLECETKGDYGLLNNFCFGITGASGMIMLNSFLALHFMAKQELVTSELNTVTSYSEE